MTEAVAAWLTEPDGWIRWCAETQLCGLNGNKKHILEDTKIRAVISRLKSAESGIPALCAKKIAYTGAGNAFWDLFFLADTGLTAEDTGICDDAEKIFSLQLEDGAFVMQAGVKPAYHCISAIILTSLVKMGYRDDPRIMSFIGHVLDSQRLDGGWHCAVSRAKGSRLENTESCPMDNLNLLMLLGQYDIYRTDVRLYGAIDFILEHWRRRYEPWRPYGFGIGSDFMKLRYPAVKYGILRVLDVLSLYPYAVNSSAFQDMLSCVTTKASDGKYHAESVSRAFADFDFGQTKEPSRWLTFLVTRIRKNAGLLSD